MRFHSVWRQWRCTPFDYRRLSFTTESPETFPQPITIQTLSFDLRTTAVSYPYWQHSKKAITDKHSSLRALAMKKIIEDSLLFYSRNSVYNFLQCLVSCFINLGHKHFTKIGYLRT
ncbi:unnamed protein product [Brassica rapa]|uniref:Uncharacterized protein n=2 Tax=Brassica TaxID=3705 RepID=A0A8D9HX48_BRACM|nr:unnamed protein product [Brassica rapa]